MNGARFRRRFLRQSDEDAALSPCRDRHMKTMVCSIKRHNLIMAQMSAELAFGADASPPRMRSQLRSAHLDCHSDARCQAPDTRRELRARALQWQRRPYRSH